MSDHHDRARLLKDESRRQRQEQLVVSDDAAHAEERAVRMEQIEVHM